MYITKIDGNYNYKNNPYFSMKCLHSEYPITAKLGDIWIFGRLDAVVRDGENYYILDYKTGAIPKNPEKDFQTMIYLLSAAKFLKTFDSLTFIYIDLKNNLNHKIEFTKEREKIYTEELIKICTQINSAQNFPSNPAACKFCEYNKFC